MLLKLSIQNYAIIDQLEINFSPRLNAITGETGAGKSIIAGALGLILGDRADTTVLVNKEKKCVVEGSFDSQNEKLEIFLLTNELEQGSELLLRREIYSSGKTRAFINDTPVNLFQLAEAGRILVDLHQQFDALELGESDFQREVLDALASNQALLKEFRHTYQKWKNSKKTLEELELKKQLFEKEKDYHQFQFQELHEASFKANELEDAEAELKLLGHGEGIKNAIDKATFILDEGETTLIQQLKTIITQLNPFSSFHPSLADVIKRFDSSKLELQDLLAELYEVSGKIQFDPAKIEQLNERLALGYRLLKKHSVKTTNELIRIQQELEERLNEVLNIQDLIDQSRKETETLFNSLRKIGSSLSDARKKQVKPFEKKVNQLLGRVGMPNARLMVTIEDTHGHEHGFDLVNFLFNANASKNELAGFYSIKKVASGGELSRLMLCIKSLVAESIDLPVMIFDEIDSGISGEAARQVGIIMKELAQNRQVICITHQPQIAGKATAHFYVYKQPDHDKIRTFVRELTKEERITTIAKMLSGEKPTAAAIENARELVTDLD